MTVSLKKKAHFYFVFKKKAFLLHCIIVALNILFMAKYISSVVVVLSPKREFSSDPLVSKVLLLDVASGCTTPHVVHFVNKSPLIKPYLSKYDIISLTFKYSEL